MQWAVPFYTPPSSLTSICSRLSILPWDIYMYMYMYMYVSEMCEAVVEAEC